MDGETNTVSISSYTGGAEYESLDTTATAQVVVEDTTDITAVSLGDVTVDEGSGTATISATIDNAPTDEPLVLTLDNGATITFAVGETTATSSEFVVQGDDPYVDGETNTVSISSYTGGAEYESLDTTATAQVVVEDTTDITAVSLGDVTVDEGSGTATISATIDNAPTDEPLVLTLDNGATITFAVGETTATSSEFVVQGDDPYKDGETNTVSISSYTGGAEYESLDTTATAQVVVEDTTDITAVSLGDVTVDEGSGTATISATIDNAPTDEPLVLTLDNGATITFAVGETTATSSEFVVQGDDPYVDGETNTVSISSYTGGAEYESLDTTATAQVVVEDTTDITAVSLGDVTVDEGSGTATISATIDNAPTDEPLVLTLDNGATITFAVGETTATSSEFVVQGDDPYRMARPIRSASAAIRAERNTNRWIRQRRRRSLWKTRPTSRR
ncbi:immunoglobulin-like domain-containing protein [Synechococcus sp. CBW1006]|uniref:immunoglobulin-like domain-containing protein n=1 Tax=Synechococcus sp. CBW1006 TaxID=1353138 RepID=UPI00351CA682